jgi:hypothetical protein
MGGPDGGRDLEATLDDHPAWIAVGFVNSANDSSQQRSQITRKFKQDLDRALTQNPGLEVFGFVTNVRLTPVQRNQWLAHGNSRGLIHTVVFDREDIRIVLDSPMGLASRYQYLDIPLSLAEQSAFFSHWGDQLETLIAQSFDAVGRRIDRLEFLQEATLSLRDLGFSLPFSLPPTCDDLPHFRAVLVLSLTGAKASTAITLAVAGRCDTERVHSQPRESFLWLGDELIDHFRYVTSGPPTGIYESSTRIGGHPKLATLRMMDLDAAWMSFYVNAKAASLITSLSVRANDYVCHTTTRFIVDTNQTYFGFDPADRWHFELSPATSEDPWVRITTGDGPLDFARRSPFRREAARALDASR